MLFFCCFELFLKMPLRTNPNECLGSRRVDDDVAWPFHGSTTTTTTTEFPDVE